MSKANTIEDIEKALESDYEDVEVASISHHPGGRKSARVWVTEPREEEDTDE